MSKSKPRSAILNFVSKILFFLIVIGGLTAAIIVIFYPYSLIKESAWLGPSKWVYVRNPYLLSLAIIEGALGIIWLIVGKNKPFLHWILILAAIGGTIASLFLLNSPPSFLG